MSRPGLLACRVWPCGHAAKTRGTCPFDKAAAVDSSCPLEQLVAASGIAVAAVGGPVVLHGAGGVSTGQSRAGASRRAAPSEELPEKKRKFRASFRNATNVGLVSSQKSGLVNSLSFRCQMSCEIARSSTAGTPGFVDPSKDQVKLEGSRRSWWVQTVTGAGSAHVSIRIQ